MNDQLNGIMEQISSLFLFPALSMQCNAIYGMMQKFT